MPLRTIPDVGPDPKTAWRTTNRITIEFVVALPASVWTLDVPAVPRRTVREILVHLHNARCRWIKTLGREHGIKAPLRVDQRRATQRQLAVALKQSSMGIEALLDLGSHRAENSRLQKVTSGGTSRSTSATCWRTSSRTRRITVDRSSSSPDRPDSDFRRPSSMPSGGGRNPSRSPTPNPGERDQTSRT
jgi:hypothetical protein